jgi:hypothetical protein
MDKQEQPIELVEVYSAADPDKAYIIKNALEEEDIRAFVENENQAALVGLTMQEVKVLVEVHQAEKAREFIEEHEERVLAHAQESKEENESGENATSSA